MWRGFKAAFVKADLDPILASRHEIQAARKAPAIDILRAMALDPVAFFGRRIVIRQWRGRRSDAA